MNKIIIAVLSLFSLFVLVSAADAAGCSLVGGKTYYSDGVSLFKDSACHQEMTSADLSASTSAATTDISTGSGNCRLVSGRTYYTDGVSLFKDSACHQEMTNADLNAATTGTATTTTYISTGNGNCHYDSSRQQFTDGTAFFTDNKCSNEALNGETVSSVSASPAASAVAVTPASVAGDAQLAQLSQRVDALEKRVAGLQTILVQLLAFLLKK